MDKLMQGKAIIVTGAGSVGEGWGNGKAAAVLYAREGGRVLAVDRSIEAALETQEIIRSEGGECEVLAADVSRSADVKAIAEAAMAHFGRVDVLHNNVGIAEVGGPVETSEESWNRLVAVNQTSLFLTHKHVLPIMEKQRKGVSDGWVNPAEVATGEAGGKIAPPEGATPAQVALYTLVSRVLLNMDETITKE